MEDYKDRGGNPNIKLSTKTDKQNQQHARDYLEQTFWNFLLGQYWYFQILKLET